MWPWGHAAFGYVLYSPARRLVTRRAPTAAEVVALLVGTQLPDLVDKPLSWTFELFPSGYAVAHSALVAGPLGLAALAVAAWRDRPALGVAFAVGWWSHLAGDVVMAIVLDQPVLPRVLWPVAPQHGYERDLTAFERLREYFEAFVELATSSPDPTLLAVYFGPLVVALVLWLADGAPVARDAWRRATGR